MQQFNLNFLQFGFRAQFGEEKVIVRIQYDHGTSFKTLLCTKSDLAGEICHKMAAYSTSYRSGTKLYKSLLENKMLAYTEELDYLVTDHSSFQLFQPSHLQELGRWLCPGMTQQIIKCLVANQISFTYQLIRLVYILMRLKTTTSLWPSTMIH